MQRIYSSTVFKQNLILQFRNNYNNDSTAATTITTATAGDSSLNNNSSPSMTRTGVHRKVVSDFWGNSSVNGTFECGSFLFDTCLEEPVQCRVFVESRKITFQSVREGEDENCKRFLNAKFYVYWEPQWCDYIAMGVILERTKFSLVLNGIIVEFVAKKKGDRVKILQRHIDPSKLPHDLKLKVVPIDFTAINFLEDIRDSVRHYRPTPLTFRNCHVVAEAIVEGITYGKVTLKVKTLNTSIDGYYSSVKLVRQKSKLWKK
jgi:hypothetical protein